MSNWIKQSTITTITLGPFLDEDDGKTPETGLSIVQGDIRLSKNGASFAQTNNTAGSTHDENGYYKTSVNATDTGSLGHLHIHVHKSGALPVWQDYMVLDANSYDGLVSGTDWVDKVNVSLPGTPINSPGGLTSTARVQEIFETVLDDAEIELTQDTMDEFRDTFWGMLPANVSTDTLGEHVVDLKALEVKLTTMLQSSGALWQFTENALAEAPINSQITADVDIATLLYGPSLTMVDFTGRTGLTTIKGVLINSMNKVFNTSTNSFDTNLESINFANAIIALAELPGFSTTGMAIYRAAVPAAVPIGTYTVVVQEGSSQSSERLLTEMVFWDGQSIVPMTGVLAQAYASIRAQSSLGTGSLSKTITMTANNGNPVPNIPVWVTLDADSKLSVAGPMLTDDSGNVTFMLNPGSYYAWGHGLNTNVVNPKTFNVP